jgi:hypothetical protein
MLASKATLSLLLPLLLLLLYRFTPLPLLRLRYKVVQISRLDADGHRLDNALIIKARDMTAVERVAEDLKRAEEKAADHSL